MQMEGGGVLNVRQEGGWVKFMAARPRDEAGLYKVWLRGEGGREYLLGTLIPEGQMLRLNRSVSLKELDRENCWPVEGASVRLAFSFAPRQNEGWAVISGLPDSVPDNLLRRSLRGELRGRRGEKGQYLVAAPFRRDRPVALEPLFCLGRVEEIGGEPFLVWVFDGAGKPVPPVSSSANSAG